MSSTKHKPTEPSYAAEPGGERVCRRLIGWLLAPVGAVTVTIWLFAADHPWNAFIQQQTERVRSDSFVMLVLYAAALTIGAVLLASMALLLRPRSTRWIPGLIFLVLTAGWGLLVWELADWLMTYFPAPGPGPSRGRLDPRSLHPTFVLTMLAPPVIVVIAGRLFGRSPRQASSGVCRPVLTGELLRISGMICVTAAAPLFLLGMLPSLLRGVGLGLWLGGPASGALTLGAIACGALLGLGGYIAVTELGIWVRSKILPGTVAQVPPSSLAVGPAASVTSSRTRRLLKRSRSALRERSVTPRPSQSYLWMMLGLVPAVGLYWAASAFVFVLLANPLPDVVARLLTVLWFMANIAGIPMLLSRWGVLK